MILLLENKMNRLDSSIIKDSDTSIEIVTGDSACNTVLNEFVEEHNIFDDFTTIVIHESIYEEEKRDSLFKTLTSYCEDTEKKLVIFSGNNTQANLHKNTLRLSPKILYKHLNFYIKNEDLLILAYGKKSDINLMLNILEKLNLITKEQNFTNFKRTIKPIEAVLKTSEYKQLFENMKDYEDYIDTTQIMILANNLKKLIQENAHA